MKKASSSFLLVVASALFIAVQGYAQPVPHQGNGRGPNYHGSGPVSVPPPPVPNQGGWSTPGPGPGGVVIPGSMTQVIQRQLNQTIMSNQRLRLIDLLQVQGSAQSSQLMALTLEAQSLQGNSQLIISRQGQIVSRLMLSPQLLTQRIVMPSQTLLAGLEISTLGSTLLRKISAEVSGLNTGGQYPQEQIPLPNSMLTLELRQSVVGHQEIDLTELARRQLGVTLRGVDVDRVVIEGRPLGYGRSASVRLEINNRPASQVTYLSDSRAVTPLRVQSYEQIQRLTLVVDGEAFIDSIRVRVGESRSPYPQGGQFGQRVQVGAQLMMNQQLFLSQLVRSADYIETISIQGSSTQGYQANVLVMTTSGEVLGQIQVGGQISNLLRLPRSVNSQEIKLLALSPVFIQSIDLDF